MQVGQKVVEESRRMCDVQLAYLIDSISPLLCYMCTHKQLHCSIASSWSLARNMTSVHPWEIVICCCHGFWHIGDLAFAWKWRVSNICICLDCLFRVNCLLWIMNMHMPLATCLHRTVFYRLTESFNSSHAAVVTVQQWCHKSVGGH